MTVSNVITLPVITKLDTTAERVLDAAKDSGLKGCVVLGWDEDGEEYFASSYADGGEVLWLLERLKMKLLGVPDRD